MMEKRKHIKQIKWEFNLKTPDLAYEWFDEWCWVNSVILARFIAAPEGDGWEYEWWKKLKWKSDSWMIHPFMIKIMENSKINILTHQMHPTYDHTIAMCDVHKAITATNPIQPEKKIATERLSLNQLNAQSTYIKLHYSCIWSEGKRVNRNRLSRSRLLVLLNQYVCGSCVARLIKML